MSLAHEVSAAAASATGLSVGHCFNVLRRIREKGLWPVHTRNRAEQTVTDRDLANYTAALLGGLAPQNAHVTVARLAEARLSDADHRNVMQDIQRFASPYPETLRFLEAEHSFLDALAALYAIARSGPAAFEEVFRLTSVSLDQNRLIGTINLHGEEDPMGRRWAVSIMLDYAPTQEFFRGDLEVRASLPAATIATLARTADRVMP